MHVIGLFRTSGYNIPAAAAAADGEGDANGGEQQPPAATKIGRTEITSNKILKKNPALERELKRWVFSLSASFPSRSPLNAVTEASLLTVLRPPQEEVAAKQQPGGGERKPRGVIIVSPPPPTSSAAAATGMTETTLSEGQSAVVYAGDCLFFPNCPRELVRLRIMPGAAERDARELDRLDLDEMEKRKLAAEEREKKKKRKRAEGASSAALLPPPEPFHRWHLSFFNTRFSASVEKACRDQGATVSRLLLFLDCKPGSACEDVYLSLFPPPPPELLANATAEARDEAAAAEVVAAEVRAEEGPRFFSAAQRYLRDAGLPPPRPSSADGACAAVASRASAVIIGGAREHAGIDGPFAECCEIRVLRLAGLWPPPASGYWAKRSSSSSSPASPSSAAARALSSPSPLVSAAAALLPRSDFPVLLLPRTFITGCLSVSAAAGGPPPASSPRASRWPPRSLPESRRTARPTSSAGSSRLSGASSPSRKERSPGLPPR